MLIALSTIFLCVFFLSHSLKVKMLCILISRLLIFLSLFSSSSSRQTLILGGSLSLLQPPPTRSQGNQILINSSSSSNVYPMDCEPSIINISSSSLNQPQPSLNINQQRYLQHMHSRGNRYNNVMAPPTLSLGGGNYISQQKYAPASLPLDLITVAAVNNSSSIMVLPSTQATTSQDHLNSSLIINNPSTVVTGGYAPFTNHDSKVVVSTGSSRNNSNTNNNNATSNDDSMVGVCVQQSPVVIH